MARTIRLFVSSPFVDFVAERETLQKRVFPYLKALCDAYGVRFEVIDLRWGVSEEAVRENLTMSLCLKEVRRCTHLLVLLGDRYGWRPLAETIEADEFERLLRYLKPKVNMKLDLLDFYRKDTNPCPPVYRLCTSDDPESESYESIRQLLHQAALEAGLASDEMLKYSASATEQEIAASGVLQDPDGSPRLYCAFRTIEDLSDHPFSDNLFDIDEDGKPDIEARHQLETLKCRLEQCAPGSTIKYRAKWTGNGIDASGLDAFCAAVRTRLETSLKAEIAQMLDKAGPSDEGGRHLAFAQNYCKHFVGRAIPLESIRNYIDEPKRQPFIVVGEPGSGKTTVLAKSVIETANRRPAAILVARFVGATPQSMNTFELLSSICLELAAQFPIEQTAPGTFDGLLNWFGDLIGHASESRPLVIFIDGINQLQTVDMASDLQWLAQPLPPQTSLVISTISGHPLKDLLSSNIPDIQSHCLEGMPASEGQALLGCWLQEKHRALTDTQTNLVMEGFDATHSPLYLRLAFVETLSWRSFDLPKPLPKTTDAVIDVLYARLIHPTEHGEVLVSQAISYLLCGRQGLSEQELKAVLSADKNVIADIGKRWPESKVERLPDVLWSRLRYSLEPYLLERGVHQTTTLDFFHSQFRIVFERRVFTAGKRKIYHARLAKHFKMLDLRMGPSGPANSRRAFELPYQLARAGRFEEFYRTLLNFDFLQAKSEALGIYDLLEDFNDGVECGLLEATAIGPDKAKNYALARAAIELSAHVVGMHPDQLAGQLIGRLLSDEPTDIRHLCDEISRWRQYAWFRPRTRILNAPGGALLRIHQTGSWGSETLALLQTGGGELIAAASSDHSIKLWSLETGRLWRTLYGHSDMPRSLAVTADGRRLVSVAEDKTLKLWSAEQSQPTASLSIDDLSPLAVGLSPKGDFALCAHEQHPLLLWQPNSSQAPTVLEGPIGLIRALAISSDGTLGASVGWDHTLWVWDLASGRLLRRIDNEISGEALAVTADGRLALVASDDGKLHVWDLMAARRMRSFAAHDNLISTVAMTADGRIGVSGSRDRLVKVWDLATGGLLATLRGHTEEVGAVAIDPHGRSVVSADRIIAISDIDAGEIGKVYGCDNTVDSLAISPDGRHVVYVSSGQVGALALSSGEPDASFLCDPADVNHVAFAGNGVLISSGDGILQTWRYGSAKPLQTMESAVLDGGPVGVSADARLILAAGTRFPLKVWDLDSGEMRKQLEGHTRYVRRIAITPDARRAVSVSWDDSMRVWDLDIGEAIATHSRLGITGEALASAPDGRTVLLGMDDNTATIRDLATGQLITSLAGHTDRISSVAFLPDGEHAATASRDGTARIWNLSTGEAIHTLRGHSNGVNAVAVSHDGRRLVTTSLDGTVRVWNLDAEDTNPKDEHHRDFVRAVRISRDGLLAVSCSDDGTLKSWDLTSGKPKHKFNGHQDAVWAIEPLPDDLHLLSGARDGTLMLWHLPSSSLVHSVQAHDEALTHISLSVDGRTAVTCAYDNRMKAWSLPSCALLKTFHGDESFLTTAVITQDGRFAVGGTMEGSLLIGDIQGPEPLRRLVAHPESVENLVLIPGRHQVLSCGLNDDRMQLWDLDAGRILKTFGTDGQYYQSLAISTDGRHLVATCTDTYKVELEVWQLDGPRLITRIEAFHEDRVSALALCHNGHWVLSASADHTVRLWDLELAEEIATFTADGGLSCAATTADGSLVVAGSEAGVVHVLTLERQPYTDPRDRS